MSVQRTGNFNVGIYYNENLDKDGNSWHLVVLDKFTPTGTYVGKKTFYSSLDALIVISFCRDALDSLWKLPDNSKIKGGRWVWETV